MRKTARTVVWEGAGAQSPAPDPIGTNERGSSRGRKSALDRVGEGGERERESERRLTGDYGGGSWYAIIRVLVRI